MTKKVLILAAVVVLLLVCNVQADCIEITWVGGDRGEWDEIGNWDPWISSSPDNRLGGPYCVTIHDATVSLKGFFTSYIVDTLDVGGTVELRASRFRPYPDVQLTLEVGSLTNRGELTITELDIEPRGTVGYMDLRDPNNDQVWVNLLNYGTIQFQGSIDVDDDFGNMGSIEVTTGTQLSVDGFLINNGTITVVPSGALTVQEYLYNKGQIIMYGDLCGTEGQFLNDSTGVISGMGILHGKQSFENEGTISALAGLLVIAVVEGGPMINSGLLTNKPLATLSMNHPAQAGNVTVSNHGTIEVNAGGGVAFDTNMVNESDGVIQLRGGVLTAPTITQMTGATFEGFGGITGDLFLEEGLILIEGGDIPPSGLIRLTGPTNIVGNVNVPLGAELEISDGQTLITGHTTNNGTIHLIGGTVIFQGGYSGAGSIINEAGVDRNHFDLNADGIEDFKDFAYFAETWLWQASWY